MEKFVLLVAFLTITLFLNDMILLLIISNRIIECILGSSDLN